MMVGTSDATRVHAHEAAKTNPHFANTHMTRPQGEEMAAMQAQTFPGMAHWAGSGPVGKSCRECASWCTSPSVASGYKRDGEGNLTSRRCDMFVKLMRRGNPDCEAGPAVPHDAAACRHFVQAEAPPLVRNHQPIDGITIRSEKRKSKYRVGIEDQHTGRAIYIWEDVPAVRAFKKKLVETLSHFDWTVRLDICGDSKERVAAMKALEARHA